MALKSGNIRGRKSDRNFLYNEMFFVRIWSRIRKMSRVRKLCYGMCGLPCVCVREMFQTKVNYIYLRRRAYISNKKRKRKILYGRELCAAFCHWVRGYKFRDFVGGAISKTWSFLFFASKEFLFARSLYLLSPPSAASWVALVSTTILVQLAASHA